MVKFLKFLVVLASMLIVASIVWLYTLDGKYDTSRSKVINAPAKVIFDNVNDFKEWKKWDPWTEVFGDNMKVKFSGKDKGVNAKYTWSSDESGEVIMEIISSTPYTSINQTITFMDPFESTSNLYWKFEDTDKGTKVTWGMRGTMPFFRKGMANSMDAMMEKDLLKGLENLNKVSINPIIIE